MSGRYSRNWLLVFAAIVGWSSNSFPQNLPSANFSKVLLSRQTELKNRRDFAFALKQPAQVVAHFRLSSDTDWQDAKRPAVLLEAAIDERLASHVVTYLGRAATEKNSHPYSVHLGFLAAGKHELALQRADSSNTEVRLYYTRIDVYNAGNPFYVVLAQAPIIYGRGRGAGQAQAHTPWLDSDMRFSDVPLLLAFEQKSSNDRQELKYTVFFSNENGGTTPPGLLHLWGRYTDIEWVYRTELDAKGNRIRATYQGEDHQEFPYLGGFENEQPALQVSTLNNLFSDSLSTKLRFALPPFYGIPADGLRESVMLEAPWTWQVSAKEARREQRLNPHPADTTRIDDLRRYLYLQFIAEPQIPAFTDSNLERKVGSARAGGHFVAKFKSQLREFASNLGSSALIVRSDKKIARQTAIPLPVGVNADELQKLEFVADSSGTSLVLTNVVRLFSLDDNDLPREWKPTWRGALRLAPGERAILFESH